MGPTRSFQGMTSDRERAGPDRRLQMVAIVRFSSLRIGPTVLPEMSMAKAVLRSVKGRSSRVSDGRLRGDSSWSLGPEVGVGLLSGDSSQRKPSELAVVPFGAEPLVASLL